LWWSKFDRKPQTDEEVGGADGEESQDDVSRSDVLVVSGRHRGSHPPPRVSSHGAVPGHVLDEKYGAEQPRREAEPAP